MRISRLLMGLLFVTVASATPAFANDGCRDNARGALLALRDSGTQPDLRAELGVCLVRNQLGYPEVAAAVQRVLCDPKEDLFLREDLARALGGSHFRRNVKVREALAPRVSSRERAALAHTADGAGNLLAVAAAVDSMDETVAVTDQEGSLVRALSELAESDETPVLLRAAAVDSLEHILTEMVGSKLFDERTVRTAQETLRNVAGRDDNASAFTGAGSAYARLAEAGLPYFASRNAGRSLASENR